MNLRWNPDGKGIRDVPPELQEFARAKRREFLQNCLVSAATASILGRILAIAVGVPDAADPAMIVQAASFLMVSTLVLGVGVSSLF